MIEYVSIEQVQEQLSVSRDTVERMIARGDITAVKIGKCVRVSVESIERYLQMSAMSKAGDEA